MNTIKSNISKAFTIIPNDLINDSGLSDRARFLFCYMAVKPNDWVFYQAPLARSLNWSLDTLRKYLLELLESGWISREIRREEGKFDSYDYTLHEKPCMKKTDTGKNRHGKKPTREKTDTGKVGNNKEIPSNKQILFNKEIPSNSIYIQTHEEIQINPPKPEREVLSANDVQTLKNDVRDFWREKATVFIEQMHTDGEKLYLIEPLRRKTGFTEEQIFKAAHQFAQDQIAKEDFNYPGYRDFKSHFYNWLPMHVKNLQKQWIKDRETKVLKSPKPDSEYYDNTPILGYERDYKNRRSH